MPEEEEEDLLIDREEYLAAGVHIGTQSSHVDMEPYIFRRKDDRLAIIDLEITDEKIREAAEFLSDFKPDEILVVGEGELSGDAVEMFAEKTGAKAVTGRFTPGMLTNPETEKFTEPEAIVVASPEQDGQAVREAARTNTPVVAVADSGDSLEEIDMVIPGNNKGANAVGTVFYLLARELLRERGEEPSFELDDFQREESEEEEEE